MSLESRPAGHFNVHVYIVLELWSLTENCLWIWLLLIDMYLLRQYRGNEGQMRELQDQLEAEQYFSVSITVIFFVV